MENSDLKFIVVRWADDNEIEFDAILNVYEKVGWFAPKLKSDIAEKFKIAFNNSYRVSVVMDSNLHPIGVGRLISDGVQYGSIFDVVVLPEFQKMGVGKAIMTDLMEGLDNLYIHLTSTFGNEPFYKNLGFKKHKTAYAKYPGESEYLEK